MSDVELVIKMPEEIYKHILSMQFYIPGLRSGKSLLEEILKAIRTGTPLPKGHGRLIDAEALDKDCESSEYHEVITSWLDLASTIIKAANAESEERDEMSLSNESNS